MPAKPSSPARQAPRAAAGNHVNNASHADKQEAKILFQKYFKSVGPRTYAAQIKEAANGNHFLVLIEGKRDEASGEVKKSKVFVFSEDFGMFFRMLHETAQFIKAHPVPEEIKLRRQRYWARKEAAAKEAPPPPPPVPATKPIVTAKAPAKPVPPAKSVTRRPMKRR